MQKFKGLISKITALFLGFSIPVTAFAAAPVVNPNVPPTVDVTLQKLEFMSPLTPEITNTGLPIDPSQYPADVTAYEPAKYGDVEFSLYRLNLTSPISDTLTPTSIADAVETEVLKDTAAASVTFESGTASLVQGPVKVDAAGKALFPAVPTHDENSSAGIRYVAVETKAPATVVAKARPMFIELPITNEAGTGYLQSVTLYPKNEVKTLEIGLAKLFTNLDGTTGNLPNVLFHLYKGEKGNGTLVVDERGEAVPYITDDAGKITVEGLVVGQYYLVEQQVAGLIDGMTEDAEGKERDYTYLTGGDALNDEFNMLGFSVGMDGKITSDAPFTEGYMNYDKPVVTKTITNGRTSFDRNENIPFEVKLDLPKNISDYSDLQFTDTLRNGTSASADLSLVAEPTFKTDAGTTLVKGTDYTITTTENSYTVQFVMNGSVTAPVAAAASIIATYEAEFIGDAIAPESSYNNSVDVTYNNSVEGNTAPRYTDDETPFTTFGAKFKKTDAGLFGTGVVQNGLAGAEFILTKTVDGNVMYFNGFGGTTEEAIWVTAADANTHYAAGNGILISGENGDFEIRGLSEGTYALLEMKAPVGYRLPIDNRTEFNVNATSYSDTNAVVSIANEKSAELVMTGSEMIFVSIIGAAGLLGLAFILRRNKKAA